MWCFDEREVRGATESEVSLQLHLAQPARVEVDVKTTDDQHIVARLNISRVLIVSKEERDDPIDDNTFIFLDTEGTPIDGFFKHFDDGDRNLSMHIPLGFRAYARFVELLAPNIGDSGGRLVCPAGFDVEEDWGINLEGRICPNPRLDDVTLLGQTSDPVISGPGTYQFVLTGTNFVPWINGVPGTQVVFQTTGHPATFDPAFEVTDVTWNEVGELLVTVVVHDDVEPGTRYVRVVNPIDSKSAGLADALTVQ
jgi:hypothetical protein